MVNERNKELIGLIRKDMIPALGVTEPGAIAFAAASARSYVSGEIRSLEVSMNSGMYKNAFTCGIPNSERYGALFSAALGVVAGRADLGLEALAEVTVEDNVKAEELVRSGKVRIRMTEVTSRIFIEAVLTTDEGTADVVIRGYHTNITSVTVNGKIVIDKAYDPEISEEDGAVIHRYSLADIYDCAMTAEIDDIEFIREAYRVNLELFEEGLKSPRTVFLHRMYEENGREIISGDLRKTAHLLCNGAIEARVIGLARPAMSITGSGAHGIIATMPLYAQAKVCGISEDLLLRATVLSYLICMYIKEYSGRLSAFCGCGIAAGTGTACGLALMNGGDLGAVGRAILNMAAGITGMICDGGNQGCTMKGIVALDAAFSASDYAVSGISIGSIHGICGDTPEDTMRYMGMIASPGMIGTEKTIVDILDEKNSG